MVISGHSHRRVFTACGGLVYVGEDDGYIRPEAFEAKEVA
jgi:hypothetical protein